MSRTALVLALGTLILILATEAVAQGPRPRGLDAAAAREADAQARQALDTLRDTEDYLMLCCLPRLWERHLPAPARKRLLALMVGGLGSQRELKLSNYGGLSVAGRIEGLPEHTTLYQDILVENGRCAWAIEKVLHCKLPVFDDLMLQRPGGLEQGIWEARRAVIRALRMPGPADTKPIEARAAELQGRAAFDELFKTHIFPEMDRLPAHWTKDLPEASRRMLMGELLGRLEYTKESYLSTKGNMFIMSHWLSGEIGFGDDEVMLEQDITFENGRSAWAIERLLDCVLPSFTEKGNADAKALKEQIGRSYEVVIESMELPRRALKP